MVAGLIDRLLDEGSRAKGNSYGVILLTGPGDAETVTLTHRVENDTKAASGRGWAWTLNQRYTRLDRLRAGVRYTSEL